MLNILLVLAYLFFIGSVIGWGLELLYRNIHGGGGEWITPGFCTGPYLPIYCFGLCVLFLLASMERYPFIDNPFWNKAMLFALMALGMTLIEYVAGLFCLKFLKVRLWDYSDEWGNIQGIVCPKFSAAWAVLGAVYYFFIHPYILDGLSWLSRNLAFSFFIGMFFGIFMIDVAHSAQLVAKLKQIAEENRVVFAYEGIKEHIRTAQKKASKKYHFFHPFRSELPLVEHLKEISEKLNKRKE